VVSEREALADDKDRMAFAWNQCEWAKNHEALVTQERRQRCGGWLHHRLQAMQLKHSKKPMMIYRERQALGLAGAGQSSGRQEPSNVDHCLL
jgi:hypothetical protein